MKLVFYTPPLNNIESLFSVLLPLCLLFPFLQIKLSSIVTTHCYCFSIFVEKIKSKLIWPENSVLIREGGSVWANAIRGTESNRRRRRRIEISVRIWSWTTVRFGFQRQIQIDDFHINSIKFDKFSIKIDLFRYIFD